MFAANNVQDVMKDEPFVNHVSHHLQKIATFALSWTTVFEDDVPPGSEDSSNAKLAFEDDSSMFEREAAEDVSYQNHNPTSFPQNQTQKYHAILGPYDQLHSNQPHNEQSKPRFLNAAASSTRFHRKTNRLRQVSTSKRSHKRRLGTVSRLHVGIDCYIIDANSN